VVNRLSQNSISKPVQGQVNYDDGLRSAQFIPAEAFSIPGTYFVTVVAAAARPTALSSIRITSLWMETMMR